MGFDRNKRNLLAAGLAFGLASSALRASAERKPRAIQVVARKFEFVPATVRVQRGETVRLHLTATDVPMGFNLADFQLRTDIVPGKLAVLEFTPDKTGSFIFVCDVFCGSGHEDMSGTLIVA